MGLLDRLAAQLITRSTGLPPRTVRRVVRRAGGGRLLALGGAVLAGALATESRAGQGQAWQAVGPTGGAPPPPPAPGASPALPPLPPLPGEEAPPAPPASLPPLPPPPHPGPASDTAAPPEGLPNAVLFAVVRAMVGASLADGQISVDERRAIEEQIESGGELDPEQVRRVHRDLVLPPSPAELAAMPGALEAGELIYRFAALVVKADGRFTETEEQWLWQLASELGLPEGERERVEQEVLGADAEGTGDDR